MTISYRWLCEYLPAPIPKEELSTILTSIGLEVESLEMYENFKGGLQGLVVGEVLELIQHPNADKLKLTKVNVGGDRPLNIVCGASNVAAGQKVVVAQIGTTIYPKAGAPITMKLAKIRGEESEGMICAEDEIGLSEDHAGIMVLDAAIKVGTPLAELYDYYQDWIYEIGLTPNRMDAMSHYGVAKDVCAYLTYHTIKSDPISPFKQVPNIDPSIAPFEVVIENPEACARYSGILIDGVKVGPSPIWLKNKLQAIGARSINNIVDITNFILHETGQPLHAFDAAKIHGKKVVVKKCAPNSLFTTLDEKERKLSAEDLMICDIEKPMCIAGVFGGLHSGVSATTNRIFLESAWFENVHIRKTSVFHGLRTDAATRFEKGVDIANTVKVLEKAAAMIQEIAGGKCSQVVDVYPNPAEKVKVAMTFAYLKKLSGKQYASDKAVAILTSLGFEILHQDAESIQVAVPYNKPDISIAADLVEEIVRIDGLDNIEIPTAITISPSVDLLETKEQFKNKIANYLVGRGYTEILTNSITNSKYYSADQLKTTVKMLNSLSADLDVMRPTMLETGLETIAYNNNRKNESISFFEMGKIYTKTAAGKYQEDETLAIYLSGKQVQDSWRAKAAEQDFFVLKGTALALCELLGLKKVNYNPIGHGKYEVMTGKTVLGTIELVGTKKLAQFDIKQTVGFLNFDLSTLFNAYLSGSVKYQEISKYPSVERDLALVIDETIAYSAIEQAIKTVQLDALKETRVFDIFVSDKLGLNKKSVAINFVFNAGSATLTDTEIDGMMKKLIAAFEKNIQAEIRK
jgi:phenylalanyl-tRNA synthetase beta chain